MTKFFLMIRSLSLCVRVAPFCAECVLSCVCVCSSCASVYIDDLLLIDLMRLKSILLTSSCCLRLGKIANKGSVPLSVCYLA